MDNCIILGIDPQVYLVDVINRIESGWPPAALTPASWLAQQTAQQ